MPKHALAYWPESPEALYGVGAKQDAYLRRVTVHQPDRIDMWHPDLPEVMLTGRRRDIYEGEEPLIVAAKVSESRPRFREAYRVGAVLFLSLLLPAIILAQEPCKVNVQTCAAAECSFLPGIGPSKGAAIEAAHPADEAALDAVPGIGAATLARIKPYVVFTGPTTCTSKQGGRDGAQ